MSARNDLNWPALDLDGDPVPGDPELVAKAQKRYAKIAKTIHATAKRLDQVAKADGLKGNYADKMRDKATDVHNDLTKASGRYDAVASAVKVYQPVLADARKDTKDAVTAADAARAAQVTAHALADPSANRPPDAPPLSQSDKDAVQTRNTAIDNADDALTAAKTKLQAAVEKLDRAGRALEKAVSAEAFKDDHLTDTLADKINAVLKVIVKVLQWVGIALAALALIFPGVAAFAVIGAVIAAVVLVVDIALAAQGEGSWLDVAFAAIGVVLLGAGSLLAKGLQNIGNRIRDVIGPAYRAWANPRIEQNFAMEMRAYLDGTSAMTPAEMLAARNAALAAARNDGRTAGGLLPEFPEWWQFSHPEYLAFFGRQLRDNNIFSLLKNGKFTEMYPKFLAGTDVVSALRQMGNTAGRIPGSAVGAPSPWFYGGATALKFTGYGMFGFGLASGPVAFVPGDSHHIGALDDAKDHTTTHHG